ncbi:MAG: class I SAM-dependent methyltransferase [Candidatus Heimdallarchaeota archaeon]|nr:MAG: class I SAM-dependent methyltransferase [Candidatus Heimdallarchaeota archaeon]
MPSLPLKEYQEDRQERGVYDKRNIINDLTGKEWLFSTKTIIPKSFSRIWPSSMKSRNYNPIPTELSKELIETFSKPGDTILDPFAGIGSTLFGSYLADTNSTSAKRKCIGIEQNESLIGKYSQLLTSLKIPDQGMLLGDPIQILTNIKDNSVDFILSDIPIWDVSELEEEESIAMIVEDYHKSPRDCIQYWSSSVSNILSIATKTLKKSKYLVVSIPNEIYRKGSRKKDSPRVNFALSTILAHKLQKLGLTLKAERIWFESDSQKKEGIFNKLDRRFLVFRKEHDPKNHINRKNIDSLFFEGNIPTGDTYIIHKSFPPSFDHKLRSEHGGMKPPELAQILIERYSKNQEEVVLDPFAGVGGTLLGASLSDRKAIGIDINKRWKTIYQQVSQSHGLTPQEFLIGDSRQQVRETIEDASIDLILTDVPYWAMDKLQKTRGRFSKAGEKSRGKLPSPLHHFDRASILTIDEWLILLKTVFGHCYPKLIDGKYLVVFIGNMYRTIEEKRNGKVSKVGKFLLLSSMLARVLLNIGYSFNREIIWYSPDKALHVFGYPFSYIPSIVHQSILVFTK